MVKLTILYTYYGQEERLPGIVKEKHPDTMVVIVDDCHPNPLGKLPGIDVYRIVDDITWNQPGARNLGFHVSEGWIVCADIDHLVTRENAEELIEMKKERGTVYFLGREDTDSYNVFLIHKDDFEKAGGYDEDFSGHYGHDDTHFLRKCYYHLNIEERRNIRVKVFAEESSSKLERDTTHNEELLKKKGRANGKRLRFRWEKV